MSFALGLMLAGTAGFADLEAIDRQIAAFTGAPVGAPGGALMPVDRRMRLQRCGMPLAISVTGTHRNSLQVRCPDAGWRIFVQIAAAPAAAEAAPLPNAVGRGDAVTIAVQGDGFSVSQPGEAMESGPIGAWIRVRPNRTTAQAAAARGDTLRAQIVRPGVVEIALP